MARTSLSRSGCSRDLNSARDTRPVSRVDWIAEKAGLGNRRSGRQSRPTISAGALPHQKAHSGEVPVMRQFRSTVNVRFPDLGDARDRCFLAGDCVLTEGLGRSGLALLPRVPDGSSDSDLARGLSLPLLIYARVNSTRIYSGPDPRKAIEACVSNVLCKVEHIKVSTRVCVAIRCLSRDVNRDWASPLKDKGEFWRSVLDIFGAIRLSWRIDRRYRPSGDLQARVSIWPAPAPQQAVAAASFLGVCLIREPVRLTHGGGRSREGRWQRD